MNPSFSFTWDNSKKQRPAKVFSKKRQFNKTQELPKEKTEIKRHTDKVNIHTTVAKDSVTAKKQLENYPGFIKRKRKKIKQVPQNDLQEESDDSNADLYYGKNIEAKTAKQQKPSFALFNQKPKQVYIDTASGKPVSENVFTITGHTFSDIKIHKHVLSNLEKHGFVKMTTVQEKAIPVILNGKNTLVNKKYFV